MYTSNYLEELDRVKKQFPKFKIVNKKDSFFMKLISWLLFIITFGKMSRETFMNSFHTTIGNTLYVSNTWNLKTDLAKHCTLHHESVHLEQSSKDPLFSLKYLFWPFPIFWANSRLQYEAEAYGRELAMANIVYKMPITESQIARIVANLTGPAYFWTCADKKKAFERVEFFINLELSKVIK